MWVNGRARAVGKADSVREVAERPSTKNDYVNPLAGIVSIGCIVERNALDWPFRREVADTCRAMRRGRADRAMGECRVLQPARRTTSACIFGRNARVGPFVAAGMQHALLRPNRVLASAWGSRRGARPGGSTGRGHATSIDIPSVYWHHRSGLEASWSSRSSDVERDAWRGQRSGASTNGREHAVPDLVETHGEEVANLLIDIDAVNIRPHEPFEFTSGTKSPVYVDCRKLISFPAVRDRVVTLMAEHVESLTREARVEVIAGGESAGIPYAAWIADRLSLPMAYVRKQRKGFGRQRLIEGELRPSQRVVLAEDLNFDSGSKVVFADALRAGGAEICDVVVVFDYGIPHSKENLSAHGLRLAALTSWRQLLPVAISRGLAREEDRRGIESFLSAPKSWYAEAFSA